MFSQKKKSPLTECPDCGGEVSKTAKSCPHCGRDFQGQQAAQGCGGCLGVVVLGGAAVVGLALIAGNEESSSGPQPPTKGEATVMCHDFAEKRLRAPSTADFPWSAKKVSSSQEGGTYRFVVHTYVDAENAMGARLRKSIRCVLKTDKGSDQWTLEEISFQ